jgi:hypothetical protein
MTPMLFYVLTFMASVSVDPGVALQPQFNTFHFQYSDKGLATCSEMQAAFNAALVQQRATAAGRFECRKQTLYGKEGLMAQALELVSQ